MAILSRQAGGKGVAREAATNAELRREKSVNMRELSKERERRSRGLAAFRERG